MNESADDGVRAVLERDGHSCVNCDTDVAADDAAPVWDLSGREIDAATVTVCPDCAALLSGGSPSWRDRLDADPETGTLEFLRAVTTTQGSAVADVASVTTEVTGGLDPSDPAARAQYLEGRRRFELQLAVVDRHLEAAGVDAADLRRAGPEGTAETTFEGTHALTDASPPLAVDDVDAFAAVLARARTLQRQLRSVCFLTETAIAAAGSCHVCLDSLAGSDACPACGTPARDSSAWESADGSLDTVELFGTITDRLEAASATTTELTEETGALAESLRG